MADEDGRADSGNPPSNGGTKIERLIDRYDLSDIGLELEQRWLGAHTPRQSLRELARYFNERLLEVALSSSGEAPVDGEVENLYRLLTDENVSSAARTEAESRLKRVGIDVDTLRQRFVSHQAVHTYLTTVRNVDYRSEEITTETVIANRREAIQRLRNRLVAVTERSLGSLHEASHLTIGSVDVTVNLTVFCRDCESTFDLSELFENGGCECHMRDE